MADRRFVVHGRRVEAEPGEHHQVVAVLILQVEERVDDLARDHAEGPVLAVEVLPVNISQAAEVRAASMRRTGLVGLWVRLPKTMS